MIFKGQFEYVCVVGSQGETSLTPEPNAVVLPSTNLVLVDFFGWDNSERYESDLKYLIQGLVPDNFKEGDTKRGTFKFIIDFLTAILIFYAVDFRPNLHNAEQRKFYGVFILVSPAEIAQAQHLAYVQGLYDFVNRQGIVHHF